MRTVPVRMVWKPDPMADTAGRLLRLLSLLQSRPDWTGPELAERLEVTTRTVRRDVTRLRDLGYPVEAAPGTDGGYRLGPGGRLPPLLLDDDEAVAVAVGMRAAADGSVAGIEDAALSVLTKLDQVLPAHLSDRVEAVHASTVQLPGRRPDAVQASDLVALAQACRGSVRVRFGYADREGRTSERLVEPFRLVRAGPRWYLVARDVERRAWRTFRADRISSAEATGHRFERVDPPDPVELVSRGMAVAPYPVQALIRIAAPPDEVADRVPPSIAVCSPDPAGGTLLELGGGDVRGLARYLAGLGLPVEVVDPPELRAALGDHAGSLVSLNPPVG